MPLTDLKIRSLKPEDKPRRYTDGGNLFVEVRPNGSKLWRYAYKFDGKQKLMALGPYPEGNHPCPAQSEWRQIAARVRKALQAGAGRTRRVSFTPRLQPVR